MPVRRRMHLSPERVFRKIDECNFFLEQMQERQQNENQFSFCLSAFLTALASVAWFIPMAESDPGRRRRLKGQIARLEQTHPDLTYLLNARDAEVHREGVAIRVRFGMKFPTTATGFRFPRSRLTSRRFEGRFAVSRFERPRSPLSVSLHRDTWRFEDRPIGDIVNICAACLNLLSATVRQAFAQP
jgi:hypothetical protein